MNRIKAMVILALTCGFLTLARAEAPPPERPVVENGIARMPHVEVDLNQRQVRVECEVIHVDMPLEFFCVVKHLGPEHETLLRTEARPSHVHLGLLMLGLQPGQPVRYSPAMDRWLAPHGPPLHLLVEYDQDGQRQRVPAHRWMRNVATKRTAPAFTWVFVGSQLLENGTYAADSTGYIVSVVNFDMTVIDVPQLASADNELLDWELDPERVPPAGTKVWMVIEPAGDRAPAEAGAPPQQPASRDTAPPAPAPGAVVVDEQRLAELRQQWEQAVAPHQHALREAAQTHYEVMAALRREQQRLIDEADRVHRLIEQLERQYQDMTTPRPEPID